ncbi:Troponin C, isoform 3 [Cyphomyrmex costatus]|uniref:Troponin C, isoform 3 n=2 Tax=Apocrita TaxID=7400 RepID=A0A151INN5_9HYME|nr:Troponin C, isoform 3 [Cyphomyrmex costatus]
MPALPNPAGEHETRRSRASRPSLADTPRPRNSAQAPSRRQLQSPAKEAANAFSTIGWSQAGAGARSAIGHATAISPHSNIIATLSSSRSSASNRRRGLDPSSSYVFLLRKAFDSFDSGKSGSIPTEMVADILRLMGQPFNKKILDELIDEVDADKSGRLEFDEFVTLAAKFIVEEDAEALEKELREAFRLYDKEGNGYIPTTCLREILRELDDQLTKEELDMMIEEIDSDGSGTVDFDGTF